MSCAPHTRRTAAAICATSLLAFLVACADREADGAALVSRIGADRLAAEAVLLQAQAPSVANVEVAEPSWPAAIRELAPRAVRLSRDGVYVERWKRLVEEEGVFIAFPGATVGGPGGDPSLSPIRPPVYWYRIKG